MDLSGNGDVIPERKSQTLIIVRHSTLDSSMLHNFEKIYLGSSVSYAHEHLSTWSQIFESPALDSKMLCGR